MLSCYIRKIKIMPQPNDLVVVHAGNAIETGFVKSLLEEYGIPAVLHDEMMGTIAPWYIAPGGVGAVKILIAPRDYERARAIIAEFHDADDSSLEPPPVKREVKIRPIAIGVMMHEGRLFVVEGHDPMKNEIFYRPPGGGIEFGERGQETLEREFREEFDAGLAGIRYLGALENIFTCNGKPGHEIVLCYEAKFADPAFYQQETAAGHEDNGQSFQAVWKVLADFQEGRAILYPEGLLDLLAKHFAEP
jgi:ADP-ribose pyrophosphatase YjhB (NUDIX family)